MLLRLRSQYRPQLLAMAAAIALLPAGTPAFAQKTIEGRVDKLEKEMQAVQRKVFPGGAGQVISPDLTPQAAPAQAAGSPASAPIADLTARVNAIESQVARLTGQVEESGFKLRQLEEANTRLASQLQAMQAKLDATPPAPFTTIEPAPSAGTPSRATATPARPTATPTPAPAAARPAAARPSAASQARTDAVAAVERPSTGNAPLDNYTYGFRLWQAKFYPEAQVQLEDTLAKYPNDGVASRTGNLLGRAYLDDGKPTQAAKVLFENYRARPKGDRAAESLAWVGEALIQLKRPKDACLAYDELRDGFGETLPANVRDMVTKGRASAKCGA